MTASPESPRRWLNAAVVGPETSRQTWALAARERLEEVARTYRSTVTQQELATFVQERSLIRTTARSSSWMTDVLGRVAQSCVDAGEPLLSSLCVDSRGRVGSGYAVAVEVLRHEKPADPDEHAARERLACHEWFGAELPPGGGEPVVTWRSAAPRQGSQGSQARPARTPGSSRAGGGATQPRVATPPAAAPVEEKPLAVCPVHFTVLPATGVCDDCD